MLNNSSSCIMWDEAFYDDPLITRVESNTNEVNFLKRPMTLDLNPCNSDNSTKKQPTILTSPDLSMIEFNSPQLELFELSQQTTLDHIISTPTPSLIPNSVTVEQEMSVQPFIEAHHNDNSNGDIQVEIPMTSSDINSSEYQSEPQYYVLVTSNDFSNIIPLDYVIRDEPQTVPSVTSSSPPTSPTDIESQKKIKLEDKRKRNRIAASKCRQRKLDLKAKLVDNIKVLKNKNTELTTELTSLLEQIHQLKQTVVEHMKNGCEFPTAVDLNNEHS